MKDEQIIYRFFLFICSFLIYSSLVILPAHATPKEELKQTQAAMEESRQKQQELATQNKKLQRELKEIQEKLVHLAEAVQTTEAELTASEEKLRILKEQQSIKTKELAARQDQLKALVAAALKLSRMPPEAMIMMPGDSEQAMKASRALQMTTNGIKQEADSIRSQMVELDKLAENITQKHEEMDKRRVTLKKQQQEMTLRLADRRDVQEKLDKQQKDEEAKMVQLAKKADDLKDLLTSLEEEEKEKSQHHVALQKEVGEISPDEEAPAGKKGKLRSFAAAKGHIRPPVAGKLVQLFGAQGRNQTSKGITIVTRKGAQVTAPYDGEVVFTGPFLNYGRIVILRHSDDFHTLIAGLAKIEAHVGEFLLEGEPIGAMGENESENRLYVELRKDTQPIDPAPWIHGLSTK